MCGFTHSPCSKHRVSEIRMSKIQKCLKSGLQKVAILQGQIILLVCLKSGVSDSRTRTSCPESKLVRISDTFCTGKLHKNFAMKWRFFPKALPGVDFRKAKSWAQSHFTLYAKLLKSFLWRKSSAQSVRAQRRV